MEATFVVVQGKAKYTSPNFFGETISKDLAKSSAKNWWHFLLAAMQFSEKLRVNIILAQDWIPINLLQEVEKHLQ